MEVSGRLALQFGSFFFSISPGEDKLEAAAEALMPSDEKRLGARSKIMTRSATEPPVLNLLGTGEA